ncbi:cytochrome b562 family protein [Vibrio sinensis]|uniref:Cytochrome b562 family protein n=1 Tax=Vibrio sinensis TaxID=2302434 RepID=A0A3A6R3Q8_9VIBR|nr:cytochrome b562 [Vibrio sinensis]RJX75777.1 cytochrome b562 family protein [Vibrio sinensis]
MKKWILFSALVFSAHSIAADVDLKSNMKQMKVEFKQAVESTTTVEMQQALSEFKSLIQSSKQGEYPPEKQDLYMEGFDRLLVTVDQVQQDLDSKGLEAARTSLKQLDDLREEYHDKRNPSIWSKIFG